ncbi:MAG: discoidin domain-containing protein, partial [Candidatus Binatia bacterium]
VGVAPATGDAPFVIASSTYDANFPAQAAADGGSDAGAWTNRGGWQSAATPSDAAPQYLSFLFPAPRTLSELTLVGHPEAPYALRSFVFQYRTDGRWMDIEATRVRDNSEATRWTFGFAALTTYQVRLVIFATADPYARVLEVEFGGATDAEAVSGPRLCAPRANA